MNLDFSLLRRVTNGDAAMESELIDIFLESAKECIGLLREAHAADDKLLWKGQAHAFKGISMAIGAEELGGLCRSAQEHFEEPALARANRLAAIEAAYAEVENQLSPAS